MKPLTTLAVIIGLLLIALGLYYFMTPAGSLPTFFPGYTAGATNLHIKHGIASVLLGCCSFIYAWFQSKPSK